MQQVYKEDSTEVECLHWQRDYTEAVLSCNLEDEATSHSDMWSWLSSGGDVNSFPLDSLVAAYLSEFGFIRGVDIISEDCCDWLKCICACYVYRGNID